MVIRPQLNFCRLWWDLLAVEPLKPTSNQQEKEKTLLKLYINYGVLTRIGWAEDNVLKVCTELRVV